MRTIPCNQLERLCVEEPWVRVRDRICAPQWNIELQPGEKKRKVREMPCSGEGRGHGGGGVGGDRNGLQDKPTFLNTPGVVLTEAKQLNLVTVANIASISSLGKGWISQTLQPKGSMIVKRGKRSDWCIQVLALYIHFTKIHVKILD